MAVTAIHPGEQLAEELDALDMSAAELARQLDVPTNRITQILNGTRAITGDTALRLAHFFGTSAEFWVIYKAFTTCGSLRKSPENLSRLFRRSSHAN
jgi:antitoxin HigA-1